MPLQVGGGDQLYCDPVFELPTVKQWLTVDDPHVSVLGSEVGFRVWNWGPGLTFEQCVTSPLRIAVMVRIMDGQDRIVSDPLGTGSTYDGLFQSHFHPIV